MNNNRNKNFKLDNSITTDRVVDSFDEDFVVCSICHMILWKPVTCKTCENSFCSECINQWQQIQPNKCPFTCHYEERKCIAAILKTLSKLQIKCSYIQNGCFVVTSYEALEKHEQQCDYQLKKCEGCEQELLLKDLKQHQQQCDQIDLMCSTCETIFKRKDMKNHNEVQCLKQQLKQQKDQVQQLKVEFKQEIQQLKETMDQKLKNQQDAFDQEHVKQKELHEQCLNTLEKQIKPFILPIVEKFDRVHSNTIKIEENGLLAILVDKRGHCEVRGRSLYCCGINRIKFKIEKMLNNQWISFGIISQSTQMASASYSSPSFYGWGQCTAHVYLNGSDQSNYAGYDGDIKQNDVIELIINCEAKYIQLLKNRSNKRYEIPIDSDKCLFPWQLSVNLFNINDRVRILQQTLR